MQKHLHFHYFINGIFNRLRYILSNATLHQILKRIFYPGKKSESLPIREARSILIIKVDEIGDFVLVSGFLKSVRRQCPKACISIMVTGVCEEMARNLQVADAILKKPKSWRAMPPQIVCAAFLRWHSKPPDWVLIPRSGGDYSNLAYYAYWTGSTNICAHASFCTEHLPSRSGLCNHIVPISDQFHEVEKHREMLSFLGLDSSDCDPDVSYSIRDEETIDDLLVNQNKTRTLVAFGVGAGDPSRKWPIEKYTELAARLIQARHNVTIVIVGGTDDAEAGFAIERCVVGFVVNFAGKLTILQSAALLRRCSLFVGNDSGPKHIAVSQGLPVVEISKHPEDGDPFSQHSPERFRALSLCTQLLQPKPICSTKIGNYCGSDASLIGTIEVQRVLEAALECLNYSLVND